MQRAALIMKLLCVGFLVSNVCGCHFFGIDTREGIEYVTVNERKTVKEPMYTRSVPGTNLVKRWPKRLGVDYGYAPWERSRDPQAVAANTTTDTGPNDPVLPYPTSPYPTSTANAKPLASPADHWQGRDNTERSNTERSNTVQQVSAELPVGNATSGASGRPIETPTDSATLQFRPSNAPMMVGPLMPIDKTILPSYAPHGLPVMTDPVEVPKTIQPAGGIKQPNPLRLRL